MSNTYEVTLTKNNKNTFGFGYNYDDTNNVKGIFIINVGSDENGPVSYKKGTNEIPINDDDKLIAVKIDNASEESNQGWQSVYTGNNIKDWTTLTFAVNNADTSNSPMLFRIQRNPDPGSSSSSTIETSVPTDKNIYKASLELNNEKLFGVRPDVEDGKLIVKKLNVIYSKDSPEINIGDEILAVGNTVFTRPVKDRMNYYAAISKERPPLVFTMRRLSEATSDPGATASSSFTSTSTDPSTTESSSFTSTSTDPSTTASSSFTSTSTDPSAAASSSFAKPSDIRSNLAYLAKIQPDSDDESEVSSPITTKTGTKLTETIVPLPPNLSPSVSSTPSVGAKYLTNDNTLVNNRNVGTILLNNGTTYYGPMDATVDTTNPPYELLHISSLYGKIRDTKGIDLKPDWNDILYDPLNPTNIPKSDWEWTNNYLIKQQYVVDDTSITLNDEISIVIFMNDYIYNGPLGMISIDKTVPHYEITLLHVSSKYGQIADMNGDVIIKPTDVPLLSGLAPPSSNVGTGPKWSDVLFDNNNITTATSSIKKLTGIWEWTEYFDNYFSVPGLVMPDPNTQLSELMQTELTKRVDMDNIVFKTDNLEMMKPILEHEIIVVGQAIILTLKYIYENNISAYTISSDNKKKCDINIVSDPKSETGTKTGTRRRTKTKPGRH